MDDMNDSADMNGQTDTFKSPNAEPQDSIGTETANVIFLDPSAYPDAKDGDTVSTTVEGTFMEHEGNKMLLAKTAEGKPVQEISPEDEDAMEGEDGGDSALSDQDLESQISDYGKNNAGPKGYQ